jgi:hypothetical protein
VKKIWYLALILASITSGSIAWKYSARLNEFPFGCDSFGYLQMAKEFRIARGTSSMPNIKLRHVQISQMIEWLDRHFPNRAEWDEVVAPHAHHFFPNANSVGPQYPPGTAQILSYFKEGEAVARLNQATIIILGLFACLLVVLGFWLNRPLTTVVGITLIHAQFAILERVAHRSYSINAFLLPAWLLGLLIFAFHSDAIINTRSENAWLFWWEWS